MIGICLITKIPMVHILPLGSATDSDIVNFLVDQEVGTWEPGIPEHKFMDHAFDLM